MTIGPETKQKPSPVISMTKRTFRSQQTFMSQGPGKMMVVVLVNLCEILKYLIRVVIANGFWTTAQRRNFVHSNLSLKRRLLFTTMTAQSLMSILICKSHAFTSRRKRFVQQVFEGIAKMETMDGRKLPQVHDLQRLQK